MTLMSGGLRISGKGTVCLFCLAALWLTGGCGHRGFGGTVPVKGRVTFAGGPCPHSGSIFFVPTANQSAGSKPRTGSGRFAEDGRFEVTTLVPGDGLLPGSYAPRVVCELPSEDDDQPGRSFMPAGFVAPDLSVPVGDRGPLSYEVDVPQVATQTTKKGAR